MSQERLFSDPPLPAPVPDACSPARSSGRPRLREANRTQLSLESVDLDSLLPDDHRVRLLWAAVERLDLTAFLETVRACEHTVGRSATDPKILVCLWLYATSDGVGSAREVERLCREHLAYRWICGGVTVNNHLLSEFRVGHRVALDGLMTQVLGKLMAAGLVTLDRVAHDGMRVRASAGASSFGRRSTLDACLHAAKEHVAALAQEIHDPELPARRRAARVRAAQDRIERVEAALAEMPEAEARQKRAQGARRGKEPRVSTTDVDARVMKMADGGFRPAYNVQLSADVDSRFIVGARVVTVGSDVAQLGDSIEEIWRRMGRRPKQMLVDGGYVNLDAIDAAEAQDITIYAPVRAPRAHDADKYERKERDTDLTFEWRTRMATDEGKAIYRDRAATIETVNGDLRLHRGLDRLLVRGAPKVICVTLWAVLAYNLLRLHPAVLG